MTPADPPADPPAGTSHTRELAVLTGAKTVANVALRWVSVFLPTLERAFSTSTGTLTTIMGAAELGGLSTTGTGRWLDRGHERRVFLAGTFAVAVSSAIALGGTTWTFAIAYALLIVGVGNLTVAGHAWIGHRVAFTARGRSIGVFELSWALALLLGAPLLALLIRTFGWRAPYVGLILAALLAGAVVLRWVTPGVPVPASGEPPAPLPRSAFAPMIASAATAAAGLGIFVVSGAWLDDRYDVSTGGLGAVAAASGAVELMSSSAVATISDRVGARRSVLAGLVILLGGVVLMLAAGDSKPVAIAALLVFLCGFEYGFVSSLTLVSEAAPFARGRAIGISNAFGTLARSSSVVVSGQLYEAFGIEGSLAWVTAAATVAAAMTLLTRAAGRTR